MQKPAARKTSAVARRYRGVWLGGPATAGGKLDYRGVLFDLDAGQATLSAS